MGNEYKIRFRYKSTEQVDQILRKFPYFSQYLSDYKQYEYRFVPDIKIDKIPDVSIAVLPDGFYFCDHCGNDLVLSSVLKNLEETITGANQVFVIEDLE